jgi:hypothetical protein
VHEADQEGSQPPIISHTAEPAAVEPRQRRALLGVPVRTGLMTVRVPVHVVAVRMQVIVEVEHMSGADAWMSVGRADGATHPCQGENAEHDQHDADGEFHRPAVALQDIAGETFIERSLTHQRPGDE